MGLVKTHTAAFYQISEFGAIPAGLRFKVFVSFSPVGSTMTSHTFQSYKTRLLQIVFGLAVVAAGLNTVRNSMGGSDRPLKTVVSFVGLSIALISLKNKYWLLSAFCFGFSARLQVIPFEGTEFGSLVLLSMFAVRKSLDRNRFALFRKGLVWAAAPFLAWMSFVWLMNPTGMFILGSSTIGGRFYFKVYLAFCSMVVLSAMRFNDRDSRLLLLAYLFGVGFYVGRRLLFGDVGLVFDSNSPHYVFSECSKVAAFVLCRYSATEIATRFWPFLGCCSMFLLTVYSGNRHSLVLPVFAGGLTPFLLRRDRFRSLAIMVVAAMVLGVVVAGHGSLWRLPFGVQRSLSFLPGRWTRQVEDLGFQDSFREEMRRRAIDSIVASPWVGSGGFSIDLSAASWASSDFFGTHALTRNWHNVWLGMAADFGIPLSVAWGFFMAVLIRFGYKGIPWLPPGSWSQTAYLFFYLLILAEFANFFFNGGHTSLTVEKMFLWAGLMVSVLNGSSKNDNTLLGNPS